MTRTEALRRIELQDRAAAILGDVRDRLGQRFGGAWFDAGDRGRLKIGVAIPGGPGVDEAKALLAARGVGDQTDFVGVRASLASLLAAHPGLKQELLELIKAGKVVSSVRPSINSLVVRLASSVTDQERAAVEAAVTRVTVPVKIEQTSVPTYAARTQACSRGGVAEKALYCDLPLRGGVRINTVTPGTCTLGFPVFWRYPYPPYKLVLGVMTAGHCLYDDPNRWETRSTDGNHHGLGVRARWEFGVDGDAGVIATSLDSRPWVVVDSSNLEPPTTYDEEYPIRSSGYSEVGMDICRTSGTQLSSGDWTGCGEVTDLDVLVWFHDHARYVDHLNQACIPGSTAGGSGGPYYKGGIAYGLHSGASAGCIVSYQGAREAQVLTASTIRLTP